MIVLDTHVLSELIRSAPDANVSRWIGSQPTASLFTTTLTEGEMLLGANLLPAGKRRAALFEALSALFDTDFAGRVLPFDSSAARAFAALVSERRAAGKPINQIDAQIAAIARSLGAVVATRNTDDFQGAGVALLNPWNAR